MIDKTQSLLPVTDEAIAALARQSLGEWLAWPDAPRDGPREVDNEQVRSWLSGLPNKLASLTNESARRQSHSLPGDVDAAAAWLFDNRWSVPHPMGCRWQEAPSSTQEAWTAYAKGVAAALTPSPCPGDVGMREALERIADATRYVDNVYAKTAHRIAIAALTPSALSGDAGEGEA